MDMPSTTRRGFLKWGGVAIAASASLPAILEACGSSPSSSAPIKIGILLPFSGVYAGLGDSIHKGMALYFDKAKNKAAGRALSFYLADEGATNDVALEGARRLIQTENVDVLMGSVSSAAVLVERSLAIQTHTPFVVSLAGATDLASNPNEWVYRVSYNTPELDIPFAKYIYDNVAKKVVLAAANYIGGTQHMDAFKGAFTALGGTILAEILPPLGTADYAPYLAQIAAAHPEATYSFFAGADAIHFVQQYSQFGLKASAPLTGTNLTDQAVLYTVGSPAEGVLTSNTWAVTLDNASNREYVDAWIGRYHTNPDVFGVYGYDSAQVVVHALQNLNGDTSNRAKIAKAIGDVSFESPRGIKFKFNPKTHDPHQLLYARTVDTKVPSWLHLADGDLVNTVVANLGVID